MKKLSICMAAVACNFFLLPVHANDNYCYPPTCDPCCEQAGFDGFYIGGNLGVAGCEFDRRDVDGFLTDNSGWSATDIDVIAGIQVGYDWQCCNSLLGLVVDWNWANHSIKLRDNINDDQDNAIDNDFEWFTTIRTKAGLTLCDALVYLTAGAAVARFETKWTDSDNDSSPFKHNDTKWGWTGGVGIEYLVGCKFSLGLELLYMQFPDKVKTFGSTKLFNFGHSESVFVGRIILNYRLGDLCGLCCR